MRFKPEHLHFLNNKSPLTVQNGCWWSGCLFSALTALQSCGERALAKTVPDLADVRKVTVLQSCLFLTFTANFVDRQCGGLREWLPTGVVLLGGVTLME